MAIGILCRQRRGRVTVDAEVPRVIVLDHEQRMLFGQFDDLPAAFPGQRHTARIGERRLHHEQSAAGAADRIGQQVGADSFGVHGHGNDLGAMTAHDGDEPRVRGALDDHGFSWPDQRADRHRQRGLSAGGHDHLRRVDGVDLGCEPAAQFRTALDGVAAPAPGTFDRPGHGGVECGVRQQFVVEISAFEPDDLGPGDTPQVERAGELGRHPGAQYRFLPRGVGRRARWRRGCDKGSGTRSDVDETFGGEIAQNPLHGVRRDAVLLLQRPYRRQSGTRSALSDQGTQTFGEDRYSAIIVHEDRR